MIPKICWDPTACQESVRSLEDRMVERQRSAWKKNDDWAAHVAKSLITNAHCAGRTVQWREIAALLREAVNRPRPRKKTPQMVVFGSKGLGPSPHDRRRR